MNNPEKPNNSELKNEEVEEEQSQMKKLVIVNNAKFL